MTIEEIQSRKNKLEIEWANITDGEWLGLSFKDFLVKTIMELEDAAEDARLEAIEEYPD